MKYSRFEDLPVWKEELTKFSDLRSEISNLINQAIGISKQLHGWIDSLKNSEIKGVRYFTQKEKRRNEADKEFEEFDKVMEGYRNELRKKLMERELDANPSSDNIK